MKNISSFICFMLLSAFAFSQSDVFLNINHKLGQEDFALNTTATNNYSQEFQMIRCEYYMSEITIVHDGGIETKVEDLWILSRANQPVNQLLGNYDITTIEKISFYIGVNPDNNHLDPSSYGAGHPLAPKNPSMHWGWTAGYRFVAVEGKSGNNMTTTWELHGLGDSNYNQTIIEVIPREEGGDLHIDLDADYTKAVYDILVTDGPISHGEFGDAKACVINFNNKVFTQAGSVSSANDIKLTPFTVAPNPSIDGIVRMTLPESFTGDYEIIITDINGKLVSKQSSNARTNTLELRHSGMYLIQLNAEGHRFMSQRVFVK